MTNSKKSILFGKISYITLIATFLPLPVFFIPWISIPLDTVKLFLFSFGVTVSLIFWLLARLLDGTFVFPKSRLLLIAAGIPLATLLSAIFSKVFLVSALGSGFEIQTALTSVVLYAGMILTAVSFQSSKRVGFMYGGFFALALIIGLFQLARLFFPSALSFGFLGGNIGNVIGSWNDLALFFGFFAILSLATFEFLSLSKLLRSFVVAVLVLSLFFMATVNFLTVWVIVGLFALMIFIYTMTVKRGSETVSLEEKKERPIPLVSFSVVIISLVFILGRTTVGPILSNAFNISYTDIRPSTSVTASIAAETLKHDPIFGAGANRFKEEWSLYHPASINTSPFWNASFNASFGFVPTFIVTLGILGMLVWILFAGFFIYQGFKKAFIFSLDTLSTYLVFTSFFTSLYLWIIAWVYVPGAFLIIFAFIMTGIFIAVLTERKLVPQTSFSYLKDPRTSFFSIFSLVIVLVLSLSVGYLFIQKFIGNLFIERGVHSYSISGVSPKAERFFLRGAAISGTDDSYALLTQYDIAKLNQLFSQKNISQDTMKSEFQNIFGGAQAASQSVLAYDPTNFSNWMLVGQMYQTILPLGVTGAYDNAKSAYTRAHELNPQNPSITLALARLESDNKNPAGARTLITEALSKKPNYTDAIFLLSQIEAESGNIREAIRQAEQASVIEPNNPSVFLQVGLLRYKNNDFAGAVSALERSVALSPTFMNARYFLGLAYEKDGRHADAISQFDYLHTALPDNAEVSSILSNLHAGISPVIPEKQVAPPASDGSAAPALPAAPAKKK